MTNFTGVLKYSDLCRLSKEEQKEMLIKYRELPLSNKELGEELGLALPKFNALIKEFDLPRRKKGNVKRGKSSVLGDEKTTDVAAEYSVESTSLVVLNKPAVEVYFKENLPTFLDSKEIHFSGFTTEWVLVCREASKLSQALELVNAINCDDKRQGFGNGLLYAVGLSKLD
jgi:hypothetical protein